MTQFGHIYGRLDGPEYVALVKHIATDGLEAGFSEAAVADARKRLNEIVRTSNRCLVVRPGYTGNNEATLEVKLIDVDGDGPDELLADYTLRYDAGLNEVILVKSGATRDDDEIVYFGGRLPLPTK